jgi:pimeloyl-ACP methyl ester carboxylesterase
LKTASAHKRAHYKHQPLEAAFKAASLNLSLPEPFGFYRYIAIAGLLLSLILFSQPLSAQERYASATLLTKECINEPVFNGIVCVYFNHLDKDRESVVLVHGINGSAQDWREQITPLTEHYNLLLLDLPGFGDSSKARANYSPDNYVRLLHYVTQRYINDPFYLAGHSLGGAITLLYTAYYPDDVKRLLLTDVAGVLHKIAYTKSLTEGWATRIFGDSVGRFIGRITGEWMARIEGTRSSHDEVAPSNLYTPSSIASYTLVRTNFSPYISLIQTPVMVLWQENDDIAPLRTGQALAAQLTNGVLEIIPGTGHSPMWEQPVQFNEKMLTFLQSTDQQLHESIHKFQHRITLPRTEWVAECKNKRDMVFEGDYDKLVLHQCANIRIVNSNVRELYAYESRFEILDSYLGSATIEGSEGMITASRFEADIPLTVSRSRLDLAGVSLRGNLCSIQAKLPSVILFSISTIDSPIFKGPVFDLLQMEKDEQL